MKLGAAATAENRSSAAHRQRVRLARSPLLRTMFTAAARSVLAQAHTTTL